MPKRILSLISEIRKFWGTGKWFYCFFLNLNISLFLLFAFCWFLGLGMAYSGYSWQKVWHQGSSWVGIEPANFNLTAEGRKWPFSGHGTSCAPTDLENFAKYPQPLVKFFKRAVPQTFHIWIKGYSKIIFFATRWHFRMVFFTFLTLLLCFHQLGTYSIMFVWSIRSKWGVDHQNRTILSVSIIIFVIFRMPPKYNIKRSFDRVQKNLSDLCERTNGSAIVIYIENGILSKWCKYLYKYLNYL